MRRILEENKHIRREFFIENNLFTLRITFKVPIVFKGISLGRIFKVYEKSYPGGLGYDDLGIEQIIRYCEEHIHNQRRRARQRRRIVIEKLKSYEHTI